MDAGHAHVPGAHDAVAEHLGGKGCLLGHGKVARTCAYDENRSLAIRCGLAAYDAHASLLVVGEGDI